MFNEGRGREGGFNDGNNNNDEAEEAPLVDVHTEPSVSWNSTVQ